MSIDKIENENRIRKTSGFDGKPLRQRIGVVAGYPGSGVWYTLTDVDMDGLEDLVVENEYYQVILLGSYPGISSHKSKMNPQVPYFETLEPESGAVGNLKGAVIGEEMYYSQEAQEGEWDGTMDYSGKIEKYPWWDGIVKLYTPMRQIDDTRKVGFRIMELDGIVHVVQTTAFSPEYEPIVKIEYHYIFCPGDKAIYWYNLRQFGRIDAPIGDTRRVGKVNLAGKVPVGWAIPCNKWDCYDSYYWDIELKGLCPGEPWKLWMDHSERELPWVEAKEAPPDRLMFYYDSRGVYGGNGAIVLPGWIVNIPHVRCSMSRQYRGWWRIDDITRDDKVYPGQEVHGGLCACIMTGPGDPVKEAKQIVSQLVDTKVLEAAPEVQSATVLKKNESGITAYILNPRSENFKGSLKIINLEDCNLKEEKDYLIESYLHETKQWNIMGRIKGLAIKTDGVQVSIKVGEMGYIRIRA
ncbi:MAG: hypothetical protein FIA99_16020 [Ruminiclostridium sp.]|nr:hypothetical protein [Ruminiclostridium sp.]